MRGQKGKLPIFSPVQLFPETHLAFSICILEQAEILTLFNPRPWDGCSSVKELSFQLILLASRISNTGLSFCNTDL